MRVGGRRGVCVDPHVAFFADGDALAGYTPQGSVNRCWVVEVVFRESLLDRFGSLSSVVVRDSRADVVSDVGSSNAVMELVYEPRIRSVNSQQGTLCPGPGVSVVVRNVNISVLQPSISDQPSVYEKVWKNILRQNGSEAFSASPLVEEIEHKKDSNIAQHNLCLHQVGWEKSDFSSAESEEVIGDSSLGTTRSTGYQISGPAKDEVKNRVHDAEIILAPLKALTQTLLTRFFASGVRYVGFTLRHVVSSRVVNGVTSLPGEIRDKEESVENVTNSVLQRLVVRKSAVSALVGNDPNTSTNGSSDSSINNPEWNSPEGQWDEGTANEKTSE